MCGVAPGLGDTVLVSFASSLGLALGSGSCSGSGSGSARGAIAWRPAFVGITEPVSIEVGVFMVVLEADVPLCPMRRGMSDMTYSSLPFGFGGSLGSCPGMMMFVPGKVGRPPSIRIVTPDWRSWFTCARRGCTNTAHFAAASIRTGSGTRWSRYIDWRNSRGLRSERLYSWSSGGMISPVRGSLPLGGRAIVQAVPVQGVRGYLPSLCPAKEDPAKADMVDVAQMELVHPALRPLISLGPLEQDFTMARAVLTSLKYQDETNGEMPTDKD